MLPIFHFPTRDLIFGIVLVLLLGLGPVCCRHFKPDGCKIVDALRRTG